MRRLAACVAVALLAGCEARIWNGSSFYCAPGTIPVEDSCVSLAGLSGVFGLGSLCFWLWLAATVSGTATAVRRIENKLNEKPKAPPADDARS